MHPPLPVDAPAEARAARYREVTAAILAILDGEPDWTTAMATVACELHHAFAWFHWTGFYRVVGPRLLAVGPYQGGHGCLRIPFDQGVCGAAARERRTQLVPDVEAFPGHIACSSTTRSELVVPVIGPGGLLAVLDVDSDLPAAFGEVDQAALEALCAELGRRYGAPSAVIPQPTLGREEVLALYEAVGWRAYTREPDRLMEALARSSWVGAIREDGVLVALCRALTDGATIVYVQDVLVHPDHQRKGHGRALLEACFAAHPVRQTVLITDDRPEQHAFYRSLGLTDTRAQPTHAFTRFR